MAITYASCLPVSKAFDETSDCSVKAIAIACDTPYKKVHAHLRSLGRINRRGTSEITIKLAVKGLGFEFRLVDTAAKTVTTLPKHIEHEKNYLCLVRGHVLALTKGQVEDWTEKRRHRIKQLWEIYPKRSKNAIRKAKRYS